MVHALCTSSEFSTSPVFQSASRSACKGIVPPPDAALGRRTKRLFGGKPPLLKPWAKPITWPTRKPPPAAADPFGAQPFLPFSPLHDDTAPMARAA